MKKTILSFVLTAVMGTLIYANPIDGEKKTVRTDKSKVTWKAYKVAGSHTGTVALKSGALEFDGDQLVGGRFVVDMTTINSTDLKGNFKKKLDNHLRSGDFFATKANPTAKLVFNRVRAISKNAYKVKGDLTIKGITKPVALEVSVYGKKATATMKVDRTEYDIKYSSGLIGTAKNKLIYDEFDLVVDLQM